MTNTMSKTKQITDAMATVTQWVRLHPEIDPEDIEDHVGAVLQCLEVNKLDITIPNMDKALLHLKKAKVKERDDVSKIAEYVKIVNSWTSAEMAENMKDPEVAQAVENVLAEQKRLDSLKSKPQPAPAAPKFVPPVRTQEEQAIEDMSAEEMKRAIARGRGPQIESILQGLKAKENNQ
jgi:hypothetical protein